MYKVLALNGRAGVALSLDRDEILSNQERVFKVAARYMVDIDIKDILRAKYFAERFNVQELVFILDQEGGSFLPRPYFYK